MKKSKVMGTKKWIFWVSIGIILIIVYKFFDSFSSIGKWIGNLLKVLSPFLVAIFIAFVLYTPVNALEKRFKKKIKHPRLLSVIIVYTITILVIVLILIFIIPALFNSIVDLINNLQNYYNGITTNQFEESWAPFVKDNILKPIVDYVQKIDFSEMFSPERIKTYLSSVVEIGKVLLNIFIALICSIRILFDRESIVNYIDKLTKAAFSENGYRRFQRYFKEGGYIFLKYISSQCLDGLVVAIMMTIALLIMNVKYAALLGFIVGLFNLIPYFGAIFGVLAATLITILTGGWQKAIVMLIVMVIIQQIDANIINPRITGSSLNIKSLLVVFSVTVGGAYFGIVGMLIAVPIAVLIKFMLDDYINNRKEKNEINESNENKKVNIGEK